MTCLHDFMTALMAEKEAINKANNYATNTEETPTAEDEESTACCEYDSSCSSIGTQLSNSNNNSLRSCRTVPVCNSGRRRSESQSGGVIKLIYIVPDNAHMSPSRRLRKPRTSKSYSDPNLLSLLGGKSPVSVLKASVFDMAPILPTKRASNAFELVSDNASMASSRRVKSTSAASSPAAAARSKARAALRAEMLLDIAPTPPMKTNSGGIDTLMESLQQAQGEGGLSPGGRRARSFEDLREGRSTRNRTPLLSRQERRQQQQLQQNRNIKTRDRGEWQHRSHDDLISRNKNKNTPSSPLLGGCRWIEHLTEAKAYAAGTDESSSSISSMQNQVWATSGTDVPSSQKQKKKNTHHQMPMRLPTRSLDDNENEQQQEVVVDAGRNMVNAVIKLSYRAAYALTKNGSNWNQQPATTIVQQ